MGMKRATMTETALALDSRKESQDRAVVCTKVRE
jgi:hypothetical protein